MLKALTSSKIFHQIFLSFFLKGVSLILNLYSLSLTFKLLGKEKYGIWITLISVISWIYAFDIGIGNSLRSKLASAIALDNKKECNLLVSTSYIIILSVSFVLLIIFSVLIPFIKWDIFFQSNEISSNDYILLLFTVSICIISVFSLNLINQILNAFQKNALSNIAYLVGNFLYVLVLLTFENKIKYNINIVTLLYTFSTIFSFVIISIMFFINYKWLFPRLKYLNLKIAKNLISLGLKFFIIQVSTILIFTIDNFLITHLLGPSYVAEYNLTYRLFSIFSVIAITILSPYWSAYTIAYVNRDLIWIYKSIKFQIIIIFIPLILALVLFNYYFQYVFNFWLSTKYIKNEIFPSVGLIIAMSFYIVISIWNNIYSYFLNGIGRTKEQLITALIGSIVNIPLAILLVKNYNLGLTGIVIAMCISLCFFSIVGPFTTYKILNNGRKLTVS